MVIRSERIQEMAFRLSAYFDIATITGIGKESLFVQRSSSRLGSYEFLLLNVFDRSTGKERSLNDSCDWLEEHFGISMTKQSLDERYNTYAVSFMKSCFERMLDSVNKKELKKLNLKSFSSIQLTDATSFQLPASLSTFYKGYKGRGGKSMLKAHLNYDLLSGRIEDISLGDGSRHDNLYNFGEGEAIKAKGLYIRDLGYYDFKYFRQLSESNAYFLSRAKTNATFYRQHSNGVYEQLSWEDYLPKGKEPKDFTQVYLGSTKEKLAVRLVVSSVPKEIAEKRLQKLQAYEQKQKNKRVSEKRKAMCYYNVFITNVPKEKLAGHKVRAIYSLRWQIEIMFKLWKSHYNVDKIRKMSIFRFECYLYAQLIAILLDYQLQQSIEQVFIEDFDREMSPIKASKFIKKTL